MAHDRIGTPSAQADPVLAHSLHKRLVRFLQPIGGRLATQLDIRLVQTALDLVRVIISHRHRPLGLLLTELGGYLLSPDQAPAGAKRISNLIDCPHWSADDVGSMVWQQASARVHALQAAAEDVLVVWDGSVWEKPESQAGDDWCVLRSAKARRLARRRPGMTLPHKGPPILVPGLHWDGIVVVGRDGAPTLAHMQWWTRHGPHATTQQQVEQRLLSRCAAAWGQHVRHVTQRVPGPRLCWQPVGAGGVHSERPLDRPLSEGQSAALQLGRGARSLADCARQALAELAHAAGPAHQAVDQGRCGGDSGDVG